VSILSLEAPNHVADWAAVLRALGVSVETDPNQQFPARVQCPVCLTQKALSVYRDRPAGFWFYCRRCRVAEDTITLAATTWKTDVFTAVRKLLALEALPKGEETSADAIQKFVQGPVADRARTNAFWNKVRQLPSVDDRIPWEKLLTKCGFPRQLVNWQNRFGRFVGLSTGRETSLAVEPCFATSSKPLIPELARAIWNHHLVLPFEDVPGRIRSFLCITLERDETPTFALLSTVDRRGRSMLFSEAGFGMVSSFDDAADNRMFIVSDPLLALDLQIRHIASNPNMLPILMAYNTSTMQSLDVHRLDEAREFTVISDRLDMLAIARGFKAQGFVCTGRPDRGLPARVALAGVGRSARPWQVCLTEYLSGLSRSQAETAMYSSALPEADLSAMATAAGGTVMEILDGCFGKTPLCPRIRINAGKTLIERDDMWIHEETSSPVLTARLVIEREIFDPQRKSYVYAGFIGFRGKQIPFQVPEADTRNTFEWMRELMAEAGHGPLILNGIPKPSLMALAKQFHEPAFETGVAGVGWHPKKAAFAFPRFIISSAGEVEFVHRAIPAEFQASDLPYSVMTDACLRELSCEREDVRAFWSLATYVLSDAVLTATGSTRSSLAMVGRGAGTMGAGLLKLMGVASLKSRDLKEYADGNTWPVHLQLDGMLKDQGQLLQQPKATLAASVQLLQARALAILSPWSIARLPSTVDCSALIDHIPAVLAGYLQDVCRRRFMLIGEGSVQERVSLDIRRWWTRLGGSPVAFDEGAARLTSPDSIRPEDRLAQLLVCLHRDGEAIIPQTRGRKSVEGSTFISKTALNRSLMQRCGVSIPSKTIAELLQSSFASINEDGDSPHWAVSAEWWVSQRRKYQLEPEQSQKDRTSASDNRSRV